MNNTASLSFFFFQAEDGIRDGHVTGVQTCALPICPLSSRACAAARTWGVSQLGPSAPPRRIRDTSGLPRVETRLARPSAPIPRKDCGAEAAATASSAIWTPPSVPFLKPIGMDRPEAKIGRAHV